MAIFINNYMWQQSNKKVIVDVPVTAATKDKLSIICTSNYLKVSKPPYIFEACLANPVDHDATVVKLSDEGINVELTKLSEKRWSDLRQNLTKEEMAVERAKALEYVERMETEAAEKRSEDRRNRERLGVSEQMRVDEVSRKSREDAQQHDKQQALAEVFRISSPQQRRRRPSKVTVFSVSELTESEEGCEQCVELCPPEHGQTVTSGSTCSAPVEGVAERPAVHSARSAPPAGSLAGGSSAAPTAPLRTPGTIRCAFTPRTFPSAARESRSEEEQEWLRKQAATYRCDGALDEADLRPHEQDPRWLKERGDTFYQRGNYLAAVNAYSHAIKVSSNAPELYSNRAACHLRLNNLHKTLEDSSSALDLLTPPVEANRPSRLRCHVRRGTALLRLGAFREALAEYQMALSLDPANEKLAQDVKTVRRLAQGGDSEDELASLD